MSIKDNARRALVMTTVAALSTTFFAGCNKELPKPAELDLDSELYSSSSKQQSQSSSSEDALAVSSEDMQTSSDEDNDNRSTSGGNNILAAVVKGSSNEDNRDTSGGDNKDNNGEGISGDVSADIENADKTQASDDKQSPSDEDIKPSSSSKPSSTEDSRSPSSSKDNKPQPSSSREDSSIEDKPATFQGDSRSPSSSTEDTPVAEQPKWIETPTSGTMYINTDWVNARKEAIVGADSVRLYNINDTVSVVAKTNTDYYKIDDGSFIHSDYLSSSPVVIPVYTPPVQTQTQPSSSGSTGNGSGAGSNTGTGAGAGSVNTGSGNIGNAGSTGGTPQNGDTKVENGKSYTYNEFFGWIEDSSGGGILADHSGDNALDSPIVGNMG